MPLFKKKTEPQKQAPRPETEGELAIDAYETEKEFVIISTIAGVSSKDIDISVDEDMLVIKGKREKPKTIDKQKTYLQKECFWGNFSKRIILPEKIKISKAKATIEDGVLVLRIPKSKSKTSSKIKIKDK